MKPHFTMLARYNRWANRRLCEAAAALSILTGAAPPSIDLMPMLRLERQGAGRP